MKPVLGRHDYHFRRNLPSRYTIFPNNYDLSRLTVDGLLRRRDFSKQFGAPAVSQNSGLAKRAFCRCYCGLIFQKVKGCCVRQRNSKLQASTAGRTSLSRVRGPLAAATDAGKGIIPFCSVPSKLAPEIDTLPPDRHQHHWTGQLYRSRMLSRYGIPGVDNA